jgi:hypothetical protein
MRSHPTLLEPLAGMLLVADVDAVSHQLFPDHTTTRDSTDYPPIEASTHAVSTPTSVATNPLPPFATWPPPNSMGPETRLLETPSSEPRQPITLSTGVDSIPSSTTNVYRYIDDGETSADSPVRTASTDSPIQGISNIAAHSSTEQALPDLSLAGHNVVDDQTTQRAGPSSDVFPVPNNDDSGMVCFLQWP